jgi:hypothetical protein
MMKKTFSGSFILAAIVTVCVIVVAGYGLFLAGSPTQERMRRMDAQRLNDLQSITYAMDQYYALKSQLPATLDELQGQREVYVSSIRDPETQAPYEYRKAGTVAYELCATFATTGDQQQFSDGSRPVYPNGGSFWQHGVGRTCYAVDVHLQTPTPTPVKPMPLPSPIVD